MPGVRPSGLHAGLSGRGLYGSTDLDYIYCVSQGVWGNSTNSNNAGRRQIASRHGFSSRNVQHNGMVKKMHPHVSSSINGSADK